MWNHERQRQGDDRRVYSILKGRMIHKIEFVVGVDVLEVVSDS